jgi:hypothetical protein
VARQGLTGSHGPRPITKSLRGYLPPQPHLRQALSSAITCFASCNVRHRYFAGIANIGDVRFHAGLNAALTRLGVRAKLFNVSRTSLGVYHLEQHRLAVVG